MRSVNSFTRVTKEGKRRDRGDELWTAEGIKEKSISCGVRRTKEKPISVVAREQKSF